MDKWAEKAGLHVALSAEPSKTTIVENMLDANVALDEHNVHFVLVQLHRGNRGVLKHPEAVDA